VQIIVDYIDYIISGHSPSLTFGAIALQKVQDCTPCNLENISDIFGQEPFGPKASRFLGSEASDYGIAIGWLKVHSPKFSSHLQRVIHTQYPDQRMTVPGVPRDIKIKPPRALALSRQGTNQIQGLFAPDNRSDLQYTSVKFHIYFTRIKLYNKITFIT